MTGEFAMIEKVPRRSFIFRILDVERHADLPKSVKRGWTTDWCSQSDFVRVQWCSVVGDDDGVIARSAVSPVPGRFTRPSFQ